MIRILLIIILACSVYKTGSLLSDLQNEDDSAFPLLSLNPSLVNIITLGHKGLYSDFTYFWLLQSLIYEKEESPNPDELFAKIKLVTRNLPNIQSLYTLSCFVMLDLHKPNYCEEIAHAGMEALPNDWLIPAVIGYVFAFVMKDTTKGAYYYKKTQNIPGRPDYIIRLADKFLNKTIDKEDGERILREIIRETKDKEYKEFLLQFLMKRK